MTEDQAAGLRGQEAAASSAMNGAARGVADPFVAVLSGNGGVGKTNLVVNLAVAAAGLRARVLVVDGDLGLANIDVLLGLVSPYNAEDVLAGNCSLEQALMDGPRGVKILPAATGRSELAALSRGAIGGFMKMLRAVAPDYDLVLVDVGAGIGPSALGLATLCSRALVVTTSEPTSLADAYATAKILIRGTPHLQVELVVNGVADELQALSTHARIDRMTRRFLKRSVPFRGFLTRDERLIEAVARQSAVVELFPTAVSSRQLVKLAQGLLRDHSVAAGETSSPGFDRPEAPVVASTRGVPACTRN